MRKNKNQAVNDQGELIDHIKRGNKFEAWKIVRYIGYKEEPNYRIRFLIFTKAFNKFKPNQNNNFIAFYKQYINWAVANINLKRNKYNNNPNIVSYIMNNSVIPIERDEISKLARDLEDFY